jgi:two-component system response regulator NreC
MKPIRVMLVDDHDVIRLGIKTLLQSYSDIQVVSEARDGAEALEVYQRFRPDVVLMDITMPGMDGMEATRRLKAMDAHCRVLVLTVHEDKQYFFQMLSQGADGYVTKRAAAEELVAAIRAVAVGHVYLQPALARWLLEDYQDLVRQYAPDAIASGRPPGKTSRLEVLSERERQVLELVAQGLTSAQIGERLDISPHTVARHRERIMGKLDLHSKAELVKFAIRTGLVTLE